MRREQARRRWALGGLLFWWFALVNQGEVIFFTYPTESACRIVRQAYVEHGGMAKITECMEKKSIEELDVPKRPPFRQSLPDLFGY